MKSFIQIAAIVILAGVAVPGLRAQQEKGTRLVEVSSSGGVSDKIPASSVTAVKSTTAKFTALPVIDNGPGDLVPTEIYLRRNLIADFGGKYSQDASVCLPIYYHAGYLNLDPQGQAELKDLESEFTKLMGEYESLSSRFQNFMGRYAALHERGRPRGVIESASLLVPYAGGNSTIKDTVDPIKLIRKNEASSSKAAGDPDVNTTMVKPKQ